MLSRNLLYFAWLDLQWRLEDMTDADIGRPPSRDHGEFAGERRHFLVQ